MKVHFYILAMYESQKRYYRRNSWKIKEYARQYYVRNRKRVLENAHERRDDNLYKQQLKEYFSKTNDVCFHRESRERGYLRRATPLWYDKEGLRRLYRECIRYNDNTRDIDYHIDHIIPIRGYKVCGLNVDWNTRIASKSFMMINKFDQEQASADYYAWLKQRGF